MLIYSKSLLRVLPLVLLLVMGQLQAKTIYSCLMMDKSGHNAMMDRDMDMQQDADCCRDQKACLSLDCDDALAPNEDSCYEQTVILTINQELQQNMPILSLVGESDVDPPQVMFITLDLVFPPQTVTAFVVFPHTDTIQSGSNTYLITQRLRI